MKWIQTLPFIFSFFAVGFSSGCSGHISSDEPNPPTDNGNDDGGAFWEGSEPQDFSEEHMVGQDGGQGEESMVADEAENSDFTDSEPICIRNQPSASYREKETEVPDYTQTDPAYGGFQPDGYNYCGPTAVSNSLMWLGDRGFPALVPHSADRKKDQHDLIALLASPAYFNTNGEVNGTPLTSLLPKLDQYFNDKGVALTHLEYQGWYPFPLPEDYFAGVEIPNLDWVKAGTEALSSVWLLLLLGAYDAGSDTYIIDSGHYVTLVGHGWNGTQADSAYLTIHDPWTSGPAANAYTHCQLLQGNTKFRIEYPGIDIITRSAAGYYRLVGGFNFSHPEVLLVGAIRLDMPCP